MSAPTPAPWQPYFFCSPRGARQYWAVGSKDKGLAGIARDISKADAHLIAAAPDLREACQKMLRAVWGNDSERTGPALREAELAMRAAVAKAEGRQ